MYRGDYTAGSTLVLRFRTTVPVITPYLSLGSLSRKVTPSDSPAVACFKLGDSETSSTEGVTLELDHNSEVGEHLLTIELADDFYETGKDYEIRWTSGKAGDYSLAPSGFASFSIENRNQGDAAAVTITPVVSTVSTGEVVSQNLTAYQGEVKPYTFTLTDSEGEPIDETGDTLVLVVSKLDGTTLFEATGTVGGANGNLVTVTVEDTATPGSYRYVLWNTSEEAVRAEGAFEIVAVGAPA